MKPQLISIVKKMLNNFGVDVVRYNHGFNLSLYETLYGSEVLEGKPFFNIGAGSFFHPCWTNVDYVSDWYSGVQKTLYTTI
jgi:hypothetical protein